MPASEALTESLLPCPFCGATTGFTFNVHAVTCQNCGGEGPWTTEPDDTEAATAAWNTRAPPAALASADPAQDRGEGEEVGHGR